jgi:hypothetical protein
VSGAGSRQENAERCAVDPAGVGDRAGGAGFPEDRIAAGVTLIWPPFPDSSVTPTVVVPEMVRGISASRDFW